MEKKKQNKLGYISGSVSPIYNGRELAAVASYINNLIDVINVLLERVDLLEGEVLTIEETLEEADKADKTDKTDKADKTDKISAEDFITAFGGVLNNESESGWKSVDGYSNGVIEEQVKDFIEFLERRGGAKE